MRFLDFKMSFLRRRLCIQWKEEDYYREIINRQSRNWAREMKEEMQKSRDSSGKKLLPFPVSSSPPGAHDTRWMWEERTNLKKERREMHIRPRRVEEREKEREGGREFMRAGNRRSVGTTIQHKHLCPGRAQRSPYPRKFSWCCRDIKHYSNQSLVSILVDLRDGERRTKRRASEWRGTHGEGGSRGLLN